MGADRRGTVAGISAYLDPGCMTREDWLDYVERNGHPPTWKPEHCRALPSDGVIRSS